MSDIYFAKILKRNWKFLVTLIVIVSVTGFIFKNVGEDPYENQNRLDTRLTLQFQHQGEQVRGFLYVSYWVETPPEITNANTSRLEDYLIQHGQIDLERFQDLIIDELKTYSIPEIKDQWYSDYQYFQNRNIYFIKNDPRLMKLLKKQDLGLDLPCQLKKVFFVYLDENKFKEFELS